MLIREEIAGTRITHILQRPDESLEQLSYHFLEEPPDIKLIRYGPGLYEIPTPWTYYSVCTHSRSYSSIGKVQWELRHVAFSPKQVESLDDGLYYVPLPHIGRTRICGSDRGRCSNDIAATTSGFWGDRFHYRYLLNPASFAHGPTQTLATWEKMSLEEFNQALPGPNLSVVDMVRLGNSAYQPDGLGLLYDEGYGPLTNDLNELREYRLD